MKHLQRHYYHVKWYCVRSSAFLAKKVYPDIQVVNTGDIMVSLESASQGVNFVAHVLGCRIRIKKTPNNLPSRVGNDDVKHFELTWEKKMACHLVCSLTISTGVHTGEYGDSTYSLARIISAGPARLSLQVFAVSELKVSSAKSPPSSPYRTEFAKWHLATHSVWQKKTPFSDRASGNSKMAICENSFVNPLGR